MLVLFESVPRAVRELGCQFGTDNGTLMPLLKRLQSAGAVTRTRDQQDERRVLINLTKTGEVLREAVYLIPEKVETACRLTNKDLAELRDTLNGFGHPRSADAP